MTEPVTEDAMDVVGSCSSTPDETAAIDFGSSLADAPPLDFVDAELRADVARRLRRAVSHMERFLRRDDVGELALTEPTPLLGKRMAAEARHLLGGPLREGAPRAAAATLRSAYRLTAALSGLAAWSAPAVQESGTVCSYPVAAPRDAVAYSRYGCADTSAQELVYATMLGFDDRYSRLLLTSSGMAALSLIESFLLREVLSPGDQVLLHPGVYFETQQQIRSLRMLNVSVAPGGDRRDILAAIKTQTPRVVFVDALTNSPDFRLIDLRSLLLEAEQICQAETWFVIDGTLLSGVLDPFCLSGLRNVRVLYYESGCKYLQLGLDLGPTGVVVVQIALAERFERLRRGSGAIASESLVLPRASRDTYLAFMRLQTQCARAAAEAVAVAVAGHSAPGIPAIYALHPGLKSHPDAQEARKYPHLGGVVVFRFAEERLNRRRALESFIDLLMKLAIEREIPLTRGVSFGFRVPRIGAAWSSYDADEAFLRLSAGVDVSGAVRLAQLIVYCAEEQSA